MFRESQDRDFDNGKIKIVSTDGHELRLRWMPNNDDNSNNATNSNA